MIAFSATLFSGIPLFLDCMKLCVQENLASVEEMGWPWMLEFLFYGLFPFFKGIGFASLFALEKTDGVLWET